MLYRLIICGLAAAAAEEEFRLDPNAEPDPTSLVLEFRRMLMLVVLTPVPRFEGE